MSQTIGQSALLERLIADMRLRRESGDHVLAESPNTRGWVGRRPLEPARLGGIQASQRIRRRPRRNGLLLDRNPCGFFNPPIR